MPYLSCNNDEIADDISSIDDFVEKLSLQKKMFIYGPSGSGKTTLLKAIFDKLSNDKNCLFIDGENVGSNISRSIRDSFEELYGEDRNLYEAFKNREKNQKVVFVEKIEAISSKTARDNLITELENDFDNLIIFSSDTYEQFKLLFSSGILCNYFQYVLRGFSINQRESFITKICSIFKINEEEEVNDVIKAVKLSTSLCSVLDLSGPDILLQLTIKIVKERMYLNK